MRFTYTLIGNNFDLVDVHEGIEHVATVRTKGNRVTITILIEDVKRGDANEIIINALERLGQ